MSIYNPSLNTSAYDVSAYRKAGTATIERWYSNTIVAVNSTTAAFAKDRIIYIPFIVPKTMTIDRIGAEVTIAGTAASVIRLGIYDDVEGIPTNLILDAGTIAGDSATVQSITISQQLDAALYWLCMTNNANASPTMRTHATGGVPNIIGYPSTLGASPLATAYRAIKTYATLSSTADLTSLVASSDTPIIMVRLASYP